MDFDFAAMLVLLTAFTGLVWLVDRLVFAPKRRARAQKQAAGTQAQTERQPVLVEYCRSLFPVFLVVLVVRSFIVEPFRIPSSSMMPTLLIGDFILVNKFAYGLKLPVLNWEFLELGDPERGDVVVFRYPNNPEVDYIKRIVGLPGDRIAYRNKTVFVNGEAVEQDVIARYVGVGQGREMTGASLRVEHLGEADHKILLMPRVPSRGEGEWIVEEGHYFAMGDNRDKSNDSRYWGTVAEKYLVGEAFMVWLNWDAAAGGFNWGRIGEAID